MGLISETLYAKYIKERCGREVFENEHGFITYQIKGEECFLADMCIEPSKRGSRIFKDMIDHLTRIAKGSGCKVVTATIYMADAGKEHSISSALKVGFKILRAENGVILLGKEVQ